MSQTGSSPVNVGSNTITVRAVNGYRLLRRQVLPTLGSFRSPWRPHGDVVCVLNTRDGGSIQGYRRIGSLLAPIPPWHRALGLEPNATPEFLTPPGQVAFTHEGGKLLVTTKGNTAPSRSSSQRTPATRGVVRVGAVAAATTVLRIAALAIVAVAGLLAFRTGDVRPLRAHGGSSTPLRSSPPCCFSFLGMEGAAMATNRVRDPERNVPRAIIAGVAGVAVLYLAGTLAVLGDGAAGAARRIGRPTMRGRSQRSPVSGRRAGQRGALLNPDRHPGLRASGSWRAAARHGQGER